MKKIIFIFITICTTNIFSQNIKNSIPLEFSIQFNKSHQIIVLNIFSPDKEKVWEYSDKDSNLNKRGLHKDVPSNNWYSKPGEYKLIINLIDKITNDELIYDYEYDVCGKENKILTDIWFHSGKNDSEYYVSNIYIKRYYNSYDSNITLYEKWTPQSDGMPAYTIQNNSQSIIYGAGMWENFFGWVEKLDSGKWNYYKRGGFCGTVGGGYPIYPRGSVISHEGAFIGDVNPFVKGKYKFCVFYSTEKVETGFTILANNFTDKITRDLYLIEKEFIIDK